MIFQIKAGASCVQVCFKVLVFAQQVLDASMQLSWLVFVLSVLSSVCGCTKCRQGSLLCSACESYGQLKAFALGAALQQTVPVYSGAMPGS